MFAASLISLAISLTGTASASFEESTKVSRGFAYTRRFMLRDIKTTEELKEQNRTCRRLLDAKLAGIPTEAILAADCVAESYSVAGSWFPRQSRWKLEATAIVFSTVEIPRLVERYNFSRIPAHLIDDMIYDPTPLDETNPGDWRSCEEKIELIAARRFDKRSTSLRHGVLHQDSPVCVAPKHPEVSGARYLFGRVRTLVAD